MEYPGKMMGLGSMGAGAGENPSSSTSNLSPLAPPFTVDRFSTMLNSTPVFHYSKMPYDVEPYGHTSQFAHPSAPTPELDVNFVSTEILNTPFGDYKLSPSMSVGLSGSYWSDPSTSAKTSGCKFVYGGEVNPYYSPHVPPVISEDNPMIEDVWHCCNVLPPSGLSVSSQLDETLWINNLGFNAGTWVKSVEPVGSFSSNNANVGSSSSNKSDGSQGRDGIPFARTSLEVSGAPYGNLGRKISQEAYDRPYGNMNRKISQKVSGAPYGNLGWVSTSEDYNGSLKVGNLDDKSCLEQNFNLLPFDSTKTHASYSSSMYPYSHYLGLSCEMMQNISSFQNSCSSYEKCAMPVDVSINSSVSAIRSSPTVVIRPPPANSDIFGQSVTSNGPIHNDNAAVVHCVRFDRSISPIQKDPDLEQIFDMKEGSIPLSTVKETSTPIYAKDTSHRKIKSRYGSQLPKIDVSGDLATACDNIQAASSADNSLDYVDHLYAAIDSPCWKGASSSQFPAFDTRSRNSSKKNTSECDGFDRQEHQNTRSFPEKVSQGYNDDDNECDRNGLLKLESTCDANCPSREQSLPDGIKTRVGNTKMLSGEGVQTINDPITSRSEFGVENHLKDSFDMNFFDTKNRNVEEDATMSPNDISEGGTVAVRAAEKVLASPPPLEVGTVCAKLLPDGKLDVQTMIKAVHNLSELLLCYLSHDASVLEEKNTEILNNSISNLSACMRNKIDLSIDKLKSNSRIRDTSENLGKSQYVNAMSCRPEKTYEAINSDVQLDYQNMHGENRSNICFANKSTKSTIFSPVNITRDDDMARAIKEVLDENFLFNEEIHPQAIIFKNLWLEAEAKLCSMNYIARFDRMKIEMEKFEANLPKESEDVPEMISSVSNTAPMLILNAHGGPSSMPTVGNSFISSTTENAENVESSIMARFNILKSREDNLKLTGVEEEKQSKMVDGENAGSMMARFNILRSRDESTNMEKKQPPEIIDGAHAEPIMARFNILKSREDALTSANVEKGLTDLVHVQDLTSGPVRLNMLRPREGSLGFIMEEQQPEIIDGEFSGKKMQIPFIRDESKAEVFDVPPKLHFSHQTGILSDVKYVGSTYTSQQGLHPYVANDPTMHYSYNGRFHDTTTCSDWEHIQKDDYAWKDL